MSMLKERYIEYENETHMQKNHISTDVYDMVLNLFELYLYQNINYNTAWDWTARTSDCRFYNALHPLL